MTRATFAYCGPAMTTLSIQATGQQFNTSTVYPQLSMVHASEKELDLVAMSLNFSTPFMHCEHNTISLKQEHTFVADDLRVTGCDGSREVPNHFEPACKTMGDHRRVIRCEHSTCHQFDNRSSAAGTAIQSWHDKYDVPLTRQHV